MKQLGARPISHRERYAIRDAASRVTDEETVAYKLHLRGKGADMAERPPDLRVREWPT